MAQCEGEIQNQLSQSQCYNKEVQHGRFRNDHRKVLCETDAAGDCLITYELVPKHLYWKFNSTASRHFVKLADYEVPSPSISLRKSCSKHDDNVEDVLRWSRQNQESLKALLENSLSDSDECTFKCEARLGKVVWRHQNGDKLQDLLESPKSSEFYTRVTAKPKELLSKFRTVFKTSERNSQPDKDDDRNGEGVKKPSRPSTATEDLISTFQHLQLPEKRIMLSLKETDNNSACTYRFFLKESSDGDFIVGAVDGGDIKWTLKTDFLCFGRSHDLRIACQCGVFGEQSIPPHIKESFEDIKQSIKRNDDGHLVMKLRHGPVVVQQIRESERHTYATDAGHEFRFTHLKETTIRLHFNRFNHFKPIAEHKHLHQDFITRDLLYEVFPKYSQEVEVSMTKKLREIANVDTVLEEVRSVINNGMDVVDMAEEYLDEHDKH